MSLDSGSLNEPFSYAFIFLIAFDCNESMRPLMLLEVCSLILSIELNEHQVMQIYPSKVRVFSQHLLDYLLILAKDLCFSSVPVNLEVMESN